MHKVFYGTLLSYAKQEIKNIEPLLVRADNNFLFENSIDDAIQHLIKIQSILLRVKQSYIESRLK
jgi:hypothetical protein